MLGAQEFLGMCCTPSLRGMALYTSPKTEMCLKNLNVRPDEQIHGLDIQL